ncbi:MAG: hypothetical protein ACI39N_03300 [Lachnospiraceae bacterium]
MRKHKRNLRRFLSGLLTLALVSSMFVGTGLTGYASPLEESEIAVSDNEPDVSGNEPDVSSNEPDVSGNDQVIMNNNLEESEVWHLHSYIWDEEKQEVDTKLDEGYLTYDELLAAIKGYTPEEGCQFDIVYYPDREESPKSEIPKELFEAVVQAGVSRLTIIKIHTEESNTEFSKTLFGIVGLGGELTSMSIDYTYATKGDTLCDNMFGENHYVKLTYNGTFPGHENAWISGYKEGIKNSFDSEKTWLYTEKDGELHQQYVYGEWEDKDHVSFPLSDETPDSYVLADGAKVKFTGRIEDETYEDNGVEKTRKLLVISRYDVGEDDLTKELILEAIKANEGNDPIGRVRLELNGTNDKIIDKDVVNTLADSSLFDGYEGTPEVEFCFHNDTNQTGINISLCGLKEATEDKKVDITKTSVSGSGVKVKSAVTDYPAENVWVYLYTDDDAHVEELKAAFGEEAGEEDRQFAICSLSSGAISGVVDDSGWYEYGSNGFSFSLNNIKAGSEYLLRRVSEMDALPLGSVRELTLEGVTGTITWKTLTPTAVSISGNKATGLNEDRAYILATYKDGKTTVSKLFGLDVVRKVNKIMFNKTSIPMELPREDDDWQAENHLNVFFYPSESACDIGNPMEFKWESSDPTVVELIEEDEGRCYGGIRGLKAGTATITGTLLDGTGQPVEDVAPASCTVTVTEPEDIPEGAYPDVYAVTNWAKTLSDVTLTDPTGQGRWEWKNPNTQLSPYFDTDGHEFPAIYITANDKPLDATIWVRMVKITGVSISISESGQGMGDPEDLIEPPPTVSVGEFVYYYKTFEVENGEYSEVKEAIRERYYSVWKMNKIEIETEIRTLPYEWNADKTPSKHTLSLEIKDKETKKTVLKDSCTITVVDPEKVIDFQPEMFDLDEESNTLYIRQPADKYFKLSVASADTSVLKLGRVTEKAETLSDPNDEVQAAAVIDKEYKTTVVPYTQKAPGKTYFVITANDDAKSTYRFEINFPDTQPKLGTNSVTVNPETERYIQFLLGTTEDAAKLNTGTVKLTGKDADKFKKVATLESTIDFVYGIVLEPDDNTKDGKYQLNIAGTVSSEEANGPQDVAFELPVTITLKSKNPEVTFKQTKKVNSFYTDEEGYGEIAISGADAESIINDELTLEDCDYELTENYQIKLKDGATGADKKGYFSYSVDGYLGTYISKPFTVSTTYTKPTLVLSQKSDIIYPDANGTASEVTVLDKATKEPISLTEVQYVVDKKKQDYQPISIGMDTEIPNKYATWTIGYVPALPGVIEFRLEDGQLGKTDKFELLVKETNWSEALTISYNIKMEKTPKLALSASTITLNKNDAVYQGQQAKTEFALKGSSVKIDRNVIDRIQIVGKDATSNKAFKTDGNLVLESWWNEGEIAARFNDNNLKTGSYKYDIIVQLTEEAGGFTLSAPLTVKVVDVPVSKGLKLKTSGSIDVLDREGTAITVTPTLTNLTGKVRWAYLEGDDNSTMFDSDFNEETGKLEIRAREHTNYSTKVTYVVTPVFEVENDNWERYTIVGTPIKFKVKQGKVKISLVTTGNTLYRKSNPCMRIQLNAVSGNRDIEIERVELLNYQEDLEWLQLRTDASGNPIYFEDGICALEKNTNDYQMAKNGSYTLKFAVYLKGKAGNEKPITVQYKVSVK